MNADPFAYSTAIAYSDALAISVRLQRLLDDVARAEVHLFAYLACLLSVYYGRPAGSWGYSFATTENGYPYSAEVDEALTVLLQVGAVTGNLDFFTVTDQGEEELNFTMQLSQNTRRLPFLEGACASVLALPVGLIRHALMEEPDLQRAAAIRRPRKLLAEPSVALLHEHFEALREAVGPTSDDAMVPAVVWLNYLAEIRRIRVAEDERQ